MKIAIISDIHENYHNLQKALEKIKDTGAEQIICLGDLINPGFAKLFAKSDIPVFSLWGNNDGEKVLITKVSLGEGSNLTMSDKTYDFLEIGERKLFLTHFEDLAKSMAKSGDYDAVFYGHNHEKSKEKINDCLVLNPGELSTHKTGIASFAIYNTETNDADIIEIENPLITKWN